MSSGSIIEKIGAPIPGDKPAGEDTRADGTLRTIKDTRNEASRGERKAIDEGTDPGQSLPQWTSVKDLGLDVLSTRSKDLEIAAYVIEAVTRTDGFAGLRDAFKWTRVLVEKFWDGLYPLPHTEDLSAASRIPNEEARAAAVREAMVKVRVNALARLNGIGGEGLLISPLNWVNITQGSAAGPYAGWHYRQALDLEKLNDKEREVRVNRGAVTKQKFDQAVKETELPFFQQLIKDIDGCRSEFKLLTEALVAKCGESGPSGPLAPPSSQIQAALDDCLSVVRNVTKDLFPQEAPKAADDPKRAGDPNRPGIDNKLATRDDAFRVIATVADFFAQTEPQSLIPGALRKVIKLGRMSPAEYFNEIIEEKKVLEVLLKAHGLELDKPPPKK